MATIKTRSGSIGQSVQQGRQPGPQHRLVVAIVFSVAEQAWATSSVVSSNVAVVTVATGDVTCSSQDPLISPHIWLALLAAALIRMGQAVATRGRTLRSQTVHIVRTLRCQTGYRASSLRRKTANGASILRCKTAHRASTLRCKTAPRAGTLRCKTVHRVNTFRCKLSRRRFCL